MALHKFIRAQTAFMLMIDIQERLIPAIHDNEEIIKNSSKLLTAAKELSVPEIITEQYPKGIGPTISELKKLISPETEILEKLSFSCCEAKGFSDAILNLNFNSGSRDTVILFGIETHICVLGTAIDMIEKLNLNVVIAADACGSRTEKNHLLALDAARSLGCLVVPTETIIYHMLGQAGTSQFKALLPLFK